MNIEWKWDAAIPVAIESLIRLADIANGYKSSILFGKKQMYINGKVSSQVVSLFLTMKCDQTLSVNVEGEDATEAFRSIHAYIHELMREPDAVPAQAAQIKAVHHHPFTQAM